MGQNEFRRLRTCADGIPSVQRSSAATAGTAGPASVFEHAVRTPIELAPLLDQAPKVTPSTSLCAAQLDISRTTTGVHRYIDFVFYFYFFIMPSTLSKAAKPTSGAAAILPELR